MKDWLLRIGHHVSVRLYDGRAFSGFLLDISGEILEVREAEPGDWNSLGGEHIHFSFPEIRAAFDNSLEEQIV
ncbi:MAG: hypothetical protein FJY97_09570 [candidate division Zixibacteria bacterium]|nr:hypothetical protein [candidate division Zixibacteria bacterium]